MPLRKVMLWTKLTFFVMLFAFFFNISIVFQNAHSETTVALENDPGMLAVNPVTNMAVVTHGHSNSNLVSLVDLNTEKIIAELSVAKLPKGVAIDTAENIAVITHENERLLTIIDLSTKTIISTIDLETKPNNIAVNSKTHIAAFTSTTDKSVFFFDLNSRTVVAQTDVGAKSSDLAIDPERNIALVLNKNKNFINIIDMNNYTLIDSIVLENKPQSIDVNPETSTAIITHYQNSSVTVLDLLTKRSVIIPAERCPIDVAFNYIDNWALVLCDKDNKLLLLDINTSKIINTYLLPRHPKSIAVNSIRNIAIVADDETDGLTIISLPLSPSLPKIQITSPVDNDQIYNKTVSVSGTVERSTDVTVNDIGAIASAGAFSAELVLSAGKNTIAAIATDKYGRTACHSILVDIVTGEINGTVTNALTGWLLPFAIVTITDSKGNVHTITTIVSGAYSADIAAGTFSGSVVKFWYLPYSFSGAVAIGGASAVNIPLIPAPPVIDSVTVTDITDNSARINWVTDQPTAGSIEYGKTTSYGAIISDSIEETTHSIVLNQLVPATTYHLQINVASINGTSTVSNDIIFKTKGNIEITINSPAEGAFINADSINVTGSIINNANLETGVTINGMAAALSNNQFAVNNIPLNAGQNTITVTATNVNGTTVSKSITVNATIPGNFITLSAYPESGTAPLPISFILSENLPNSILNYQIDFNGDGVIDYSGTTFDNISHTYSSEGIYHPKVTVIDNAGNYYSSSANVTILSKTQLEALLKSKWEGMKSALLAGDMETALSFLMPGNHEKYRQIFTALGQIKINSIFSSISSIHLAHNYEKVASCGAMRTEAGGTYSYPLIFVKDNNGIWKIYAF